jgi:hypothetical protein
LLKRFAARQSNDYEIVHPTPRAHGILASDLVPSPIFPRAEIHLRQIASGSGRCPAWLRLRRQHSAARKSLDKIGPARARLFRMRSMAAGLRRKGHISLSDALFAAGCGRGCAKAEQHF